MLRTLTSLLLGFLLFQQALMSQETYVITDGSEMRPVGKFIGATEDSSRNLSIKDVIAHPGFRMVESQVPNFGLTSAAIWSRVRLQNNSSSSELIASIPHPEIERIDAYLVISGSVVRKVSLGQAVPEKVNAIVDLDHVFRFDVPIGSLADLYIRLESNKQLQLPLAIGTVRAYSDQRSVRNSILGLYMGVMAVLLLYNMFIFLSIRDRSYGTYVLYLTLVAFTQATFLGLSQYYLWPNNHWLAVNASMVFTVLTAIAANEFMNSFIRVPESLPKIHRLKYLFYGVIVVGLVARLTYWPLEGYNLLQMAVGPLALYQLIVSAVMVRRGSRTGVYFLIAWTVFLIGIVVFILKDFNILPYNDLTKYTMPLGSAIEGVLLSFGLADRINVLRREKERSQAEALAALQENERIIRDQNAILEQKVTERTHELVEANEEIKRTQVQLVNAEKMAGLGQLTAGIAHEINNPINFIISNIPPLRRNLKDMVEVVGDFRATKGVEADMKSIHEKCDQLGLDESIAELDGMIASIDEGARRTAEIVQGLRNFSRLDEDAVKKADINEGIRSTIGLLSPQVKGHAVFNAALADLPMADCHPGKLNQAVMNLLTNAAQAIRARHGDGGEGVVSIRSWHEDGMITIAVQDNGCGMDETTKARIFEPFFTTKGVGEGTGLGLSITYSIVQKHNGRIAVESVPGSGSEFRITIPVIQQQDEIALRA